MCRAEFILTSGKDRELVLLVNNYKHSSVVNQSEPHGEGDEPIEEGA